MRVNTRALRNGTRSDSVISECRQKRIQQWRGNANVSRQLLDCVLLFALYEPGPRIQSLTFTERALSHEQINSRLHPFRHPPHLCKFISFIREYDFFSVDPSELFLFSNVCFFLY